jgi:uncharacterized surface protein with fasciclin (FAS1) repeats
MKQTSARSEICRSPYTTLLRFSGRLCCSFIFYSIPYTTTRPSTASMTSLPAAKFSLYFLCCGFLFSVLLLIAGCGISSNEGVRPQVDSSDTRSKDLVRLITERDSLSRFFALLERSGLREQMESYGPWTIFVPEDRAFQRAAYRLDTLMRQSLTDSLSKILSYHMVRGRIDTSHIRGFGDSLQVSTLYEEPLTLYRRGGGRFGVNRGTILAWIPARNGVLYIIDTVLELPPPDTTAQTDILFF